MYCLIKTDQETTITDERTSFSSSKPLCTWLGIHSLPSTTLSLLPYTASCYLCWSAPLRVAPLRSRIYATTQHQHMSWQHWGIDTWFQNHVRARPRPGYLKTHTYAHSSPLYQKPQLRQYKIIKSVLPHQDWSRNNNHRRTHKFFFIKTPLHMARNSFIAIHHIKLTTIHTMVNCPSKICQQGIGHITINIHTLYFYVYFYFLLLRWFQLLSWDFLLNYIFKVKASITYVNLLTMSNPKVLLT